MYGKDVLSFVRQHDKRRIIGQMKIPPVKVYAIETTMDVFTDMDTFRNFVQTSRSSCGTTDQKRFEASARSSCE